MSTTRQLLEQASYALRESGLIRRQMVAAAINAHLSEPEAPPFEAWTIIAPDGRQWHGESPLRACAAAQRDTIDPIVAMQRIQTMVDEENAIRDAELAAAREEGRQEAMSANLATRTFHAMQSLTEGILTRGDADYLARRLAECVDIMGEHGWATPTPWPELLPITVTFAATPPSAQPGVKS